MSYTAEQLEKIATNYAQKMEESLITIAKKKEKKKLDPRASVRNRGDVCVPAESAKDKKDHFPINNEGQARNALARVQQYTSVPPWYKGSLEGLKALVSRKVHSKYPSIGKADKKKKSSSVDILLEKYGDANLGVSEELLNKYGQDKSVWDTAKNLFRRNTPPVIPPAVTPAPAPAAPNPNETGTATSRVNEPPTVSVNDLPKAPIAKSRFPAIPKTTQEALNKLKYVGQDGKPLTLDGVIGPNTKAAVDAYIQVNDARIPPGISHQPGSALFTMIERDASGENTPVAPAVSRATTAQQANQLLQSASQMAASIGAGGTVTNQAKQALNQLLQEYTRLSQVLGGTYGGKGPDANSPESNQADTLLLQAHGILQQLAQQAGIRFGEQSEQSAQPAIGTTTTTSATVPTVTSPTAPLGHGPNYAVPTNQATGGAGPTKTTTPAKPQKLPKPPVPPPDSEWDDEADAYVSLNGGYGYWPGGMGIPVGWIALNNWPAQGGWRGRQGGRRPTPTHNRPAGRVPARPTVSNQNRAPRNFGGGGRGGGRRASSVEDLIEKYGSVENATRFLNGYQSTTAALRDIAKAQFDLVGLDPTAEPEEDWKNEHESSKKMHDMIMAFADRIRTIRIYHLVSPYL